MTDNLSVSAANLRLIEKIYELMQQFDLPGISEYVVEDFSVSAPRSLPYGGQRRGITGLTEMMMEFLQWWDQPRFHVADLTANERLVVAHIDLSAVSKKTGAEFSTRVLEVWEMAAARVVSLEVFYADPADARAKAGAHPGE